MTAERWPARNLATEEDRRAYALNAAEALVESLRESNKAYTERTGNPSTVSEAEYIEARHEIEEVLLRVAGLEKR